MDQQIELSIAAYSHGREEDNPADARKPGPSRD